MFPFLGDDGAPAGISYIGMPGSTLDCIDAVTALLQMGHRVAKTQILTAKDRHALLLHMAREDLIAVKSGFSSGYAGEGPTGLSQTIRLLEIFGSEIREVDVSASMLDRLDESALTVADIKKIDNQRPVHGRWRDYIRDIHLEDGGSKIWDAFPPAIPYSLVDARLLDLAVAFWDDADGKLLVAYRRLEDAVRRRTGLSEHGAQLFSRAFYGNKSLLIWDGLGEGEQNGRANLFTGCFMSYRNPRAHREFDNWDSLQQLDEFLLVNHLFRLEKLASSRPAEDVPQPRVG